MKTKISGSEATSKDQSVASRLVALTTKVVAVEGKQRIIVSGRKRQTVTYRIHRSAPQGKEGWVFYAIENLCYLVYNTRGKRTK